MSGGPAGVYKSQIGNDLVSYRLCLKDIWEPQKILSKGRVVSSLCLGRSLWLLCGGFGIGMGRSRAGQMRDPGGHGVRMGRNEQIQGIFKRKQGQNFPLLLFQLETFASFPPTPGISG